jgi:hypothetical protein
MMNHIYLMEGLNINQNRAVTRQETRASLGVTCQEMRASLGAFKNELDTSIAFVLGDVS